MSRLTGPQNGLRLSLFTEDDSYLQRLSPSLGFRVNSGLPNSA